MIEPIVVAAVAVVTGGYTVLSALHRRVSNVDNRLDRIELTLAKDYLPRDEFMASQKKLEDHMVRIEEKLDRFIEVAQRRPPAQF